MQPRKFAKCKFSALCLEIFSIAKILFENKKLGFPRAIGIEYSKKINLFKKVYGGEIICCGGAFNSPQLLQLSGIGNKKELEKLWGRVGGIDAACDAAKKAAAAAGDRLRTDAQT